MAALLLARLVIKAIGNARWGAAMGIAIDKGPSGRIKHLRALLAGLTREDVWGVLSNFSLAAASIYGYSDSTDYDLRYGSRGFPPKAVLGLAAARLLGRPLTSDEFSGGEHSPCFAVLKSLGFRIVGKRDTDSSLARPIVLERYRQYERQEISEAFEPGEKFTRGAGRWGMPGIVETPRNSGNFVFMVTLGTPDETNPYQDELTEDGYLIWESQTQQSFSSPAIQKLLVHDSDERNIHLFLRHKEGSKYTYLGVLDYFSHDPRTTNPVHFIWRIRSWDLDRQDLERLGLPCRAPLDPAYSRPSQVATAQVLIRVEPPTKGLAVSPTRKKRESAGRTPSQIDWAERDLRNRRLGLQGEKLVFQHEVERLRAAGRHDLAEQVQHVALVDSAAGFDILSFRSDGRRKRIEVKTTEGTVSTPFFISLNEVLASRDDPDTYCIYRVVEHRPNNRQVKFFELPGDVELSCGLVAVSFRAYPGRGEGNDETTTAETLPVPEST